MGASGSLSLCWRIRGEPLHFAPALLPYPPPPSPPRHPPGALDVCRHLCLRSECDDDPGLPGPDHPAQQARRQGRRPTGPQLPAAAQVCQLRLWPLRHVELWLALWKIEIENHKWKLRSALRAAGARPSCGCADARRVCGMSRAPPEAWEHRALADQGGELPRPYAALHARVRASGCAHWTMHVEQGRICSESVYGDARTVRMATHCLDETASVRSCTAQIHACPSSTRREKRLVS